MIRALSETANGHYPIEHIDEFCDELLLEIFRQIHETYEILNLGLVSTRWHQISELRIKDIFGKILPDIYVKYDLKQTSRLELLQEICRDSVIKTHQIAIRKLMFCPLISKLKVADEKIFCTTALEENKIYIYNFQDELLNQIEDNGKKITYFDIYDEKIFVLFDLRTFIIFDFHGNILHRFSSNGPFFTSFQVVKGFIYAGSLIGVIQLLDYEGNQLQEFSSTTSIKTLIVTDDAICISSNASIEVYTLGGVKLKDYEFKSSKVDTLKVIGHRLIATIIEGDHKKLWVQNWEKEQPITWPTSPSAILQIENDKIFIASDSLQIFDLNGTLIREMKSPSQIHQFEICGDRIISASPRKYYLIWKFTHINPLCQSCCTLF